jgi:ABC-type polar amino acid transport system ATPase subunit
VVAGSEAELRRLYAAGEWLEFLRLAVQLRRNIVVSGATGSCKTTLTKALMREIPAEERLVVIEDNAHGLFGRYRGQLLGTFGSLATQSFHETKNNLSRELVVSETYLLSLGHVCFESDLRQ